MRHKNGYYGDGIPNRRQARWEMQADAILDRMSAADRGEDFQIAWAIATEMGRVTGWKPVVMRFTERGWRRLPEDFKNAGVALDEEKNSPQVKKLFLDGYEGLYELIGLMKV
jgi:hypothetical protein